MKRISELLLCTILILISLSCAPVSADTNDEKAISIIYPVSLAAQADQYIALYTSQYPQIEINTVVKNNTTEIFQLLANNSEYDLVMVPDYTCLERELMPEPISWYIRYGSCAMVISYTNTSAYANEISADNWYEILGRDNVTWTMAEPGVDARGWRTLVTMSLADDYYEQPVFSSLISGETNISALSQDGTIEIMAQKPQNAKNLVLAKNITGVVDLLREGKADYAWNYRGGAYQHNLSWISLPEEIDLSSAAFENEYHTVKVITDSGPKISPPIVFAVTIPDTASNPVAGKDFIRTIFSKKGRDVLTYLGQVPVNPGEGVGTIPDDLKDLV